MDVAIDYKGTVSIIPFALCEKVLFIGISLDCHVAASILYPQQTVNDVFDFFFDIITLE